MKSPVKLIILLVGIFLAGAGSGALVMMRMRRPPPPRPPPSVENWSAGHIKRIVEDIGLQPDQVEKIRPVVEKGMLALFNQRAKFLEDNHALREVMEREVAEYMTPEQRAKYEKI